MSVLPGRGPPLGERQPAVAAIGCKAVFDGVVVAVEAGETVGLDADGAAERLSRIENVISDRISAAVRPDVEGPAAIGGDKHRVVDDRVARRSAAAVDLIE